VRCQDEPGFIITAAFALQSDGRILIGGTFSTYDGVSRNGIARLDANGNLDTTFDIGTGARSNSAPGNVTLIKVLNDDRIVIGGTFDSFNGTNRVKLARLNADGSLDPDYNPSLTRTGNPPALPEDSRSLTVPGMSRPGR
jgi:uncharacterized delta-60 repeat protein